MKYQIQVLMKDTSWEEFEIESEVSPELDYHSWCKETNIISHLNQLYNDDWKLFEIDYDVPKAAWLVGPFDIKKMIDEEE